MSQTRQTPKIESKNIDHLGLVAGMYDELGIGEVIDNAIKQDEEKRNVSIGQAVKAMVLIKQLTTAHPLKYIVSDSALYTKDSLHTLAQNPGILFPKSGS